VSVFRKLIVVSAVAAAAVAFAASPLDAGTMVAKTLVVEPLVVEPGGTVTVRNAEGSKCLNGRVVGDVTPLPLSFWEAIPDENGNWTKELLFPVGIEPGQYTIHATCDFTQASMGVGAAGAQPNFDYEPVTITVEAGSDETPPTPPDPNTQPATAVTGTPRLTG
jgi:hypothetical protein